MRTLTDHIVEGDSANHQLTIEVVDEVAKDGANHRYDITGFNTDANESATSPDGYKSSFTRSPIILQRGPIKEVGVNGITHEAMLAIIIDRLRSYQKGPFACEANAFALSHCQSALLELQKRTRARIARGVEGTHAV